MGCTTPRSIPQTTEINTHTFKNKGATLESATEGRDTQRKNASRKINTKKRNRSSCVRTEQTKTKKMDKTGKQQQKRTELYKFKRNSLIPD